MKKCFVLNSIFLVALVLSSACSDKSSSKEKLVTAESSEEFQDPPLSPMLIEDAQKAFVDTYKSLAIAPTFKYTVLKDIVDQDESPLCMAFSFRDLMVNNLSLNEAKKPSVFSLLTHRNDYEGKLVLSYGEGFFESVYNLYGLGAKAGAFSTEASLPFEATIYQKFDDILNGKKYESERYEINSSNSKSVSLQRKNETYLGIVTDIYSISKNKNLETIQVKPFGVTNKYVSTYNLADEMKELAKALFYKKAQLISVCASHIRGFSKKLVEKKGSEEASDVNDSSPNCGRHALLAVDARLDENMLPWIRIRNSWGTLYEDSGTHEVSFPQFISLLEHKADEAEDDRLEFSIVSLSKVADGEIPTQIEQDVDGWIGEAKTLDGLKPFGKMKWKNYKTGSFYECDIENEKPVRCKGRTIWKSKKKEYRDRYYVYDGEMKIAEMGLFYFRGQFEDGKGKVTLWGNVIKDGTFIDGNLREGKYIDYFSNGRSPLVKMSEEGTFDENEELIKGVRKSYNRAGDVISTKVIE